MSRPRKPYFMTGSENNNSRANESEDQGVWETPADLKFLETKLATLRPREDRLNRDLLIFLAGRASVEEATNQPIGAFPDPRGLWPRSVAFWSRSFVGMTVLAATLLVLLLTRTLSDSGFVVPVNDSVRTGVAHQAPAGYWTSRTPALNRLTSAPYSLQQLDHLLANTSFERFPAAPTPQPAVDSDVINRKSLSPMSVPMLLQESEAAEFTPFDSSSHFPDLGANS